MRKGNSRTLLLVEDEAIIALTEKQTLEKHGYAVKTVHTGENALQTVREEPNIDLVLMDIDLGSGIDGTEAAQRILSEVELPVVFLTNHTEKEYVDRVRGITSYGYVIKHSGEFVLTESVRMALELFEAQQQAKRHEESLSEIFRQAPVGIFESRFDGTFRSVSTEVAHMLGFDSPWETVEYYNDLRAQLYKEPLRRDELLQRLAEYGIVNDFEFEARRPDGKPIFLRMNARLVSRPSEEDRVINGFLLDVTDHKLLKRQLGERVKELRCLYQLEQLTARRDASSEEVLNEVVNLLPPSWQYPEITSARIVVHDREVTSDGFEVSPWTIQSDIRADDLKVGSVEVFYREKMPKAEEGPFLAEERDLIDAVAKRLAEWIEQTEASEQMQFQSQLLEAVEESIIATDLNGYITYWNGAAERLYGWKSSEAVGKSITDVTVPEISQKQASGIMSTVAAGQKWSGEFVVRNKKGERFPARVSNSSVYATDGTVTGIVGISYDLTEQQEAAQELERVTERYKRAEGAAHLGHWEMNIATGDCTWSDEFFRICGFEPQSFAPTAEIGFTIIHSEDRDRAARHVSQAVETGETYSIEKRIVRPDGEIRWVDSRGEIVYDEDHNPIKLIGSFLDITERRKAEAELQEERTELRATVKEKEFLMRELNHRVKNNLSLVSSLISLKESALGREVDLSDIRNQVKAIEKVHQSLQDIDDITHIDLHSYIADILSSVFQSFAGNDVTIENNIPEISVRTKTAVPLGLIMNETATNALQHGFTTQENHRFRVTMEEDSTGETYILTISNTGCPFPDDEDIENPEGLGLQLVSALVGQLQGTVELQRKPRPVFTIRFPMSQI